MLLMIVVAFPCYFFMAYYLIGKKDIPTLGRKGNVTGLFGNQDADMYGIDSKTPGKQTTTSTSKNKIDK